MLKIWRLVTSENYQVCQSIFVNHNVISLYFLHTSAGDSIKLVENGFCQANGQGAMEEEVVERVTKKSDLNIFLGPNQVEILNNWRWRHCFSWYWILCPSSWIFEHKSKQGKTLQFLRHTIEGSLLLWIVRQQRLFDRSVLYRHTCTLTRTPTNDGIWGVGFAIVVW